MMYRIKVGSRLPQSAAQMIGEELESLSGTDGSISASDVVEAAQSKKSPLHPYFEWDNVRAAHLYRESQARDMLRSIVVVVQPRKGEEENVRAFHVVQTVSREQSEDTDQVENRYVTIQKICESRDMAEQVVENASRSLELWKERYAQYRRLFPTFEKKFKPVFEFLETQDRVAS